jgi:hypothetical protein
MIGYKKFLMITQKGDKYFGSYRINCWEGRLWLYKIEIEEGYKHLRMQKKSNLFGRSSYTNFEKCKKDLMKKFKERISNMRKERNYYIWKKLKEIKIWP